MTAFEKYLNDTYEVVEIIKSDEKNFIARVYDKSAKKLCIIKQRNLNSEEIYKILREINNSYIPEIFRTFQNDNKLIVIEEHIDGQNLDELLTYNIKNFDEKFVEKIFLQICDCLKILHEKNIIHRDLTLSNIMLTENNSVKIIDFGIARIFKPEKISDTEFLGTQGYAAPEQYGLFDLEQSDYRTDIYNLGIAMKKLLGENYRGYLEKILNRCTNLNPDLRYQNISDLIFDVKRSKKIFYIKKIANISVCAILIFFITQINFEDKKISPPKIEDKISEPIIEEKILPAEEKHVEKFEFPEIKIPDASEIKNFPEIKIPEVKIPEPTEKIPEPVQEIKKADKPKIFFYLNGKLTENYGKVSGQIFVKNFENWRIYEKGKYYKWFIFPDNWTAQLKIENFTDKDLINPKIIAHFSEKDDIIIERPTIKAGQIDFVDIPIANKRAFQIANIDKNGKITAQSVTLHINVESPSIGINERLQLIRYIKAE